MAAVGLHSTHTEGVEGEARQARVDLEGLALLDAGIDNLVAKDGRGGHKVAPVLAQEPVREHGQQGAPMVVPHLVRIEP